MPSSIEALMASIELPSFVPPHIQPPIAQVPSPTAEASMFDLPILRVSMSCNISGFSNCFEHFAGGLLVDDQRPEQTTVEHRLDRLHLFLSRRDTNGARAVPERRRFQRNQAGIERIIRQGSITPDQMSQELADHPALDQLLPPRIGHRVKVEVAGAGREN